MPKGKPKSILSTAIALFMATPLAQAEEVLGAGREIVAARRAALQPKGAGKKAAKVGAAVTAATESSTAGSAPAVKKSHKKKPGPKPQAAGPAKGSEAPAAAPAGDDSELSPEVAAIVNQG